MITYKKALKEAYDEGYEEGFEEGRNYYLIEGNEAGIVVHPIYLMILKVLNKDKG